MSVEKIKSSKIAAFMDVTPSGDSRSYKRFGKGISSFPISYGAKSTSETYIDEDNATTSVDGYEVSVDTEQVAMKGEPIFDYVDSIRNGLLTGSDCETTVVLVNVYKMTIASGSGSGTGQKFGATITVTDFEIIGGDIAKIKYKVSLNGNPSDVTVSIANGVFTITDGSGSGGSGSGSGGSGSGSGG